LGPEEIFHGDTQKGRMAIMGDITYEKLRKQVTEDLNARISKFSKTVADIGRNFRNLGFETAVWHPEKIHSTNLGGVDADSYIGYSRIEGKWGLVIRTIERDHESRAFVSQRVFPIESCSNIELISNALKKVREIVLHINEATGQQIEILARLNSSVDELRSPECKF
jgi:hypothetical protein